MQDLRNTLEQTGIDPSKFGGIYLGGIGDARPCYLLTCFECDLLVSGDSVNYRAQSSALA